MIEITTENYRTIAARLREEIATTEWLNTSLEIETGGIECRLTLTAIIYRRTEILPEGVCRPIADIVPLWWEFQTIADDDRDSSDDRADSPTPGNASDYAPDQGQKGQCPNDFSFSELKPFLIDND